MATLPAGAPLVWMSKNEDVLESQHVMVPKEVLSQMIVASTKQAMEKLALIW